jgi:hypothetical protein
MFVLQTATIAVIENARTDKRLMCRKKTYSCRNILWILSNFIQINKIAVLTYILTSLRQTSNRSVARHSPLLLGCTVIFRPLEGARTAIVVRSAVWRGVCQHSNHLPFRRQTESSMRQVLSWDRCGLTVLYSGPIPKTETLYYSHSNNRGR